MHGSWTRTGRNVLRVSRFLLALQAASAIVGCGDDGVGIAPNVAALRVSPSDTTIPFGKTVRLIVVAVDRSGVAVSPQPTIVFDVDKPSIASVDASGLVTPKVPGTITISARLAGANDTRVARATVAIGVDIGGPLTR